jgi:putative transposase
VQGVSTRKVKAITEELCGHSFAASSISAINQRLEQRLGQFAGRPLPEAFRYLMVDARYARVREARVMVSHDVPIAIGIDWDGRGKILGVELANRESRSSWSDFLHGLKARGLNGVELIVSDDHTGLRRRFVRSCRKPSGSAAMSISSATRRTMSRVTTTACKSCAGSMPAATWLKPAAI